MVIIIIIIIKSLINSTALQAYVIQCCRTGVPSGVEQKLPSTVTKDKIPKCINSHPHLKKQDGLSSPTEICSDAKELN